VLAVRVPIVASGYPPHMNIADKAIDFLVNPRRILDPDRLRAAVAGKTVLVTGASYGLGEATAHKLAAADATTLLVARSADKLDDLAATLNGRGGRAVAYPADLSDEDAVADLVDRINDEHGALDIIVNNAGKSIRRSLHLQYERPHDFVRTIDVNYLGPIRLLLGLIPVMRQRGRGHIVNISSIGVRVPPGPRWGAYQASQGSIRHVAAQRRAGVAHRRR
jgi:NAD(P)-dependent dehydrogenase (short-subunit alcohol dehydrogenase family)